MRNAMLLAVLLSLATPLAAQKKHKPEEVHSEEERPASDAHSFMELFSKLERDWVLAVQKKDQVSVDAIVAPEFIERDATDPDHIITRAEWMEKNLPDYKLDPLGIRSMTIRAFLGNAVVSFVQKAMPSGSGRSGDYFMVDVWVTNHGKWQVASRCASPVVHRNNVDHP
jgi:hypothetical protein